MLDFPKDKDKRKRIILSMALTYLLANMDDAIEAFAYDTCLRVGEEKLTPPNEDEIKSLIKELS